MAVLVDLSGVSARSPQRALFEDLSLTVSDGDRIGVVGINGTGKSTLLRVLADVQRPEAGVVRRGRAATVGYLAQDPALGNGTVRETVGGAPWEAEAVLHRLGLAGVLDRPVASLSGGQRRRVALAATLVQPTDLLVLDEPTNHLDLGAVTWLEQHLAAFRGGLVMVSHDRHLLDRVTTRMLELDRGHAHVHEGGYTSYLQARAERAAQDEKAETARRNLARRELAWLRRGAPARTRKPRARIETSTRIVEGRPEQAARPAELDLDFGMPRLGTQVVELQAVDFAHDGGRTVLHGVDLILGPDERLGVVGSNGSGKSTLLDLIAGRRTPVAGTVVTGPTVRVGYYDQHGTDLDPAARVRDLVAGPTRAPGSPADVALMERFWFGGELAFAPVRTLSGGERRRLQLLLVLASRPNVLLLDEPTNDLDLDTLRMVEDFLDAWPGALVVVSHDRTLLERTAERVVAVDDAGRVGSVPGGVAGWLAGAGAVSPSATPAPPAPAGARARASAPKVSPPSNANGAAGRSGSARGRRLRELDKEMQRLARQCAHLQDQLAKATDHRDLARLGTDLADAQARLAAVEDDWLALAADD